MYKSRLKPRVRLRNQAKIIMDWPNFYTEMCCLVIDGLQGFAKIILISMSCGKFGLVIISVSSA